jgi:thioredoxin 1
LSKDINCPKCHTNFKIQTDFKKETKKINQKNVPISIQEVNAENWEKEILNSKSLILVEFWHESCPSCKIFAPMFSKVSKEYENKLKFYKLNVLKNKENKDLAIKYGLVSTPTLIFFCNGKTLATKEDRDGFETEERFIRLIQDMLNKCSTNNLKNSSS